MMSSIKLAHARKKKVRFFLLSKRVVSLRSFPCMLAASIIQMNPDGMVMTWISMHTAQAIPRSPSRSKSRISSIVFSLPYYKYTFCQKKSQRGAASLCIIQHLQFLGVVAHSCEVERFDPSAYRSFLWRCRQK